MRVSVSKSEVSGKVTIPSSKSYTIRGVICASLARGVSEILSPLASDDTDAAMGVMEGIGIKIEPGEDVWRVHGGNFVNLGHDLLCRESATTYRFMTAISSLVPGRNHLVPGPGLAKRPIEPLIKSLRELGVKCQAQNDASLIIEGGTLKGGETRIVGNISSQFISALLMVSPLAPSPVKIQVTTHLESMPFVVMTMEYLEKFGIRVKATRDLKEFEITRQEYTPARFRIEGDWTSASYFVALGAVLGEAELQNLNPESLQGDKVIMKFVSDMGAGVRINQDSITITRKGKLNAIKADLANCIDLLPTMGVLAAVAKGKSELTGIARARLKESNRVTALMDGLVKMGAKVVEEENRILITGGEPKGAVINTFSDHRMAMAFSILGALAGNTTIEGAECVTKTFPEYWDIVKNVGVRIKIDE